MIGLFLGVGSSALSAELRQGHGVSEMVRGVEFFRGTEQIWDLALQWRDRFSKICMRAHAHTQDASAILNLSPTHTNTHTQNNNRQHAHKDSYTGVTAYPIS